MSQTTVGKIVPTVKKAYAEFLIDQGKRSGSVVEVQAEVKEELSFIGLNLDKKSAVILEIAAELTVVRDSAREKVLSILVENGVEVSEYVGMSVDNWPMDCAKDFMSKGSQSAVSRAKSGLPQMTTVSSDDDDDMTIISM